MKTAVVGAGRLGTSLGRALARTRFAVRLISDRNIRLAAQGQRLMGTGRVADDNASAARKADVLFLCLADDILEREASRLARDVGGWKEKIVFHCSGIQSSQILEPFRRRGAAVASFHPVQSFPLRGMPPSTFKGIFISTEGDPKACRLARKIILKLGAHPLTIAAGAKALYHAACCLASNHYVVLFSMAVGLLEKAGLSRKRAEQLLWPLSSGTLQHVKIFGAARALTGPVVRGDAKSVARHLLALRPYPACLAAYRLLSQEALRRAAERGLPAPTIKALNRLLRSG